MITFREFIEKVYRRQHFRVYQPNRDCLIYESFYTIHSAEYFDKEHEDKRQFFNLNYYKNNPFNDKIRTDPCNWIDEETKVFLERWRKRNWVLVITRLYIRQRRSIIWGY